MKKKVLTGLLGATLGMAVTTVWAAEPADWSKVPSADVTLFYPGVSPLEWILKGTEHGGARGLKKGETCNGCHSEEVADMGQKMVTGQKIEPSPIPGKAASIKVMVQAVHDDDTLYLRFSWQQPKASGAPKMDPDNPVKIEYMLEDSPKIELASQSGCWATCHGDVRTMPGGDENKTKYVAGGSLADGVFYDLNQWRSGENKAYDGYVADKRVMEGGKALQGAVGKLDGDTWTVVFTRKFTGGEGDVALQPGKAYNFGLAIHDDSATGRFHHVSFDHKLSIDSKDGDIIAIKQ